MFRKEDCWYYFDFNLKYVLIYYLFICVTVLHETQGLLRQW